jgi:hypothetical protein
MASYHMFLRNKDLSCSILILTKYLQSPGYYSSLTWKSYKLPLRMIPENRREGFITTLLSGTGATSIVWKKGRPRAMSISKSTGLKMKEVDSQ